VVQLSQIKWKRNPNFPEFQASQPLRRVTTNHTYYAYKNDSGTYDLLSPDRKTTVSYSGLDVFELACLLTGYEEAHNDNRD
jgi:hypothetical protein